MHKLPPFKFQLPKTYYYIQKGFFWATGIKNDNLTNPSVLLLTIKHFHVQFKQNKQPCITKDTDSLLVSGASGGMSRPRSRVDIQAAKQSESSRWIVNS